MFPLRPTTSPSVTTISVEDPTPPMTISSVVSIGGQVIIRGAMPVASTIGSRDQPALRPSEHAPNAASSPTPLGADPEPEQVWVQLETMLRRREAAKRFHPSYRGPIHQG